MTHHRTPVLVVGGSLVGMFTAALLSRQGVRPLVVERHAATSIHPRAAFLYQRSMEVVRSFGIEEQVRQTAYEQFEPDGAILSVESIAGNEIHRDVPTLNETVRGLSPSERLFITQRALEPMLKSRAEHYGADLRFGTELLSLEPGADAVTARLRDRETGLESDVSARYVVAADGAHSRVREQLGIAMVGRGLMSRSLTIYFRASVGPLLRGRNMSVILVRNGAFRGFFRIEKPYESGFMIVHTTGDPERPDTDCWQLTESDCRELLREGLGADIPVAIESIQKWECSALVAERMRQGRIFLAGDSAHVMPPYGGFGGNTGIHDAQNLAWKLALVCNGRAGEGLLDTYHTERRPIAQLTVEQAYARYVLRGAPYLQAQGISPFVSDVNVDLGYCYDSAAVLAEEPAPLHAHPSALQGRPGSRAPHLPLERDGRVISSIDLWGRGFVLVSGREAASWHVSGQRVASELPLETYQLGVSGLNEPSGAFERDYGITTRGAVLVRPDGIVAWRAADDTGVSAEKLAGVLRRLLARA
jgi:2-polyprenyl-6-methoxyphenol hydroxylase-like FAD-dependent oxidoreductase